ncbi:MAG: hypothetical protein K2W96_01015, partial [Gemmataceae bacterium]|nr:hypothetical protein [Gemmataceae bacterium]
MFALARELGMESKDLLALCQDHGLDIKNQLSTVEPEVREQILKLVGGPGKGAKAPAPPPPPPPAQAPVLPKPMKTIIGVAKKPAPAAAPPPEPAPAAAVPA